MVRAAAHTNTQVVVVMFRLFIVNVLRAHTLGCVPHMHVHVWVVWWQATLFARSMRYLCACVVALDSAVVATKSTLSGVFFPHSRV